MSPTNWIPAYAGMTDISGIGISSQTISRAGSAGKVGRSAMTGSDQFI
jgi:hypothetical protein